MINRKIFCKSGPWTWKCKTWKLQDTLCFVYFRAHISRWCCAPTTDNTVRCCFHKGRSCLTVTVNYFCDFVCDLIFFVHFSVACYRGVARGIPQHRCVTSLRTKQRRRRRHADFAVVHGASVKAPRLHVEMHAALRASLRVHEHD